MRTDEPENDDDDDDDGHLGDETPDIAEVYRRALVDLVAAITQAVGQTISDVELHHQAEHGTPWAQETPSEPETPRE
jgi:hypothetical protein